MSLFVIVGLERCKDPEVTRWIYMRSVEEQPRQVAGEARLPLLAQRTPRRESNWLSGIRPPRSTPNATCLERSRTMLGTNTCRRRRVDARKFVRVVRVKLAVGCDSHSTMGLSATLTDVGEAEADVVVAAWPVLGVDGFSSTPRPLQRGQELRPVVSH